MKKLPVGFFEKIRPVATKSKDEEDDIPLELSQDVLDGKRKITVHLMKPTPHETAREVNDGITPEAELELLAEQRKKMLDWNR